MAAVAALLVAPGKAIAEDDRVTAASEPSVDLAIAWSQYQYPCSDDGPCVPVALLTRDDDFADALSAAPFRDVYWGYVSGTPLLVTDAGVLSPATRNELQRVNRGEPMRVYILGGPAAVGESVVAQLRADGHEVARFYGATRIETAVAVAEQCCPSVGTNEFMQLTAVVARAYGTERDPTAGFADSLAGGRLAAVAQAPMLLTETHRLSAPTRDFLADRASRDSADYKRIERVVLLGGEAAISAAVEREIRSLGLDVTRLAGADRAGTAAEVARFYEERLGTPEDRVIVDGYRPQSWASGLAAPGPILLSDSDRLPYATELYLRQAEPSRLVCGPLVTEAACERARNVRDVNEGLGSSSL